MRESPASRLLGKRQHEEGHQSEGPDTRDQLWPIFCYTLYQSRWLGCMHAWQSSYSGILLATIPSSYQYGRWSWPHGCSGCCPANHRKLLKKLAMFQGSSCADSTLIDTWKCPCLHCTTEPDRSTCENGSEIVFLTIGRLIDLFWQNKQG